MTGANYLGKLVVTFLCVSTPLCVLGQFIQHRQRNGPVASADGFGHSARSLFVTTGPATSKLFRRFHHAFLPAVAAVAQRSRPATSTLQTAACSARYASGLRSCSMVSYAT